MFQKATYTVDGQVQQAYFMRLSDDTITENGAWKDCRLRLGSNVATLTPRSVYTDVEFDAPTGMDGVTTCTWNGGTPVDTSPESVALVNAGVLLVCNDAGDLPKTVDGWVLYTSPTNILLGYHAFDEPVTITEVGQSVAFFPAVPLGPNPS